LAPRELPSQTASGTIQAEPFAVDVVPNPKAWGHFPANEPVRLVVPGDPRLMHLALRQEVEAAFALGGWSMVDQVAVGAFGLGRFSSLGEFGPSGRLAGRPTSDELMAVLKDRVGEDRRELLATFNRVRGELDEQASGFRDLVQSYAVCRALNDELPACDEATLREATRYLSLERPDAATARRVLGDSHASHAQALVGPEGRALVRAIEDLAGPLRALTHAKEAFEKTLPGSRGSDALWLTLMGPIGLTALTSRAAQGLARELGGNSERAQASAALATAGAEFQERFAEQCIRYPILFKIGDVLNREEFVWRSRLVLALQDALDASAQLRQVLAEDSDAVWRFPGLVHRSLRYGFSARPGIAARVVADELARANAMPFFATLNAGIQLFSTTLMLVPFPPVKLATAVATLVGDAAELIESYFHTKLQRQGYVAAIDPGMALGPDASYASTAIQGVFVALGLLPIPGAVREWAHEGIEAERASGLRKAALKAAGSQ
jgi:hypothetical protein